jgi:Ca-activated chloride channel family protein
VRLSRAGLALAGLGAAALAPVLLLAPAAPSDWLASPAQRAQRHYDAGDYAAAAPLFADPLRRGNAWYRAGDFERAATAYALVPGPVGAFNLGNARLLQGDYAAAIEAYRSALAGRPGWADAGTNLAIAEARAEALRAAGEERGRPSEIGADEVVFDQEARGDSDSEERVAGEGSGESDAALRELWLRRVRTEPADFLRLRFAAQLAAGEEGR